MRRFGFVDAGFELGAARGGGGDLAEGPRVDTAIGDEVERHRQDERPGAAGGLAKRGQE
ncbi:hypothetical protein [Novosphingobium sp. BL-52-GroH]|uniref:hypothetical protein n=1 Tax=Novosphingobium sp. BL-52-GroH TaxID=3349877 RepID=UPI00384B85F9